LFTRKKYLQRFAGLMPRGATAISPSSTKWRLNYTKVYVFETLEAARYLYAE
jgi:hypothetical protein